MTRQERAERRGVRLDAARLAEVERLASYEIGNTLLLQQLALQREFGLRAEVFQVFHLVALATAQRFVRGAAPDDPGVDARPLLSDERGAVSRRRIAETLGIPLETVRRHVASLVAAGLVAERGRGRIATTGGTLARLRGAGTSLEMARREQKLAAALLRLGVLVPDAAGARAPDAAPEPWCDQSGSAQISSPRSPSSAI